jgi:hypothetical protein
MSNILNPGLVATLAGRVTGFRLRPQEDRYAAARVVHNGLIDRKPALIVRCRTTNWIVGRELNDAAAEYGLAVTGGAGFGTGGGLLARRWSRLAHYDQGRI